MMTKYSLFFVLRCYYNGIDNANFDYDLGLIQFRLLSVESQKGINKFQRCSIEKQKGAIAVQVFGDSALLVLKETWLNSVTTLLALS